jgi:predicted anti-sigma-YlaC factor YlaD
VSAIRPALALIVAGGLLAGCSLRQMAVDRLGDALAEGGGVYATDDDPDLVREAVPFGLKTIEALLEQSPEHDGLLLAAARGFVGYAFLLQQEADLRDAADREAARSLRSRASRLYRRGRDYALRGLDGRHRDITDRLAKDADAALAEATAADVPLLYWAAAGSAGALAADKGDVELLAELPTAGAMMRRVLELDPRYEDGAADEFLIAYEGSRPGGSAVEARRHYERALALSGGKRASVHLALAEAVAVPAQDKAEFQRLLQAALAVDPEAVPDLRLVNTLAHRRALWLQARIAELFVVG